MWCVLVMMPKVHVCRGTGMTWGSLKLGAACRFLCIKATTTVSAKRQHNGTGASHELPAMPVLDGWVAWNAGDLDSPGAPNAHETPTTDYSGTVLFRYTVHEHDGNAVVTAYSSTWMTRSKDMQTQRPLLNRTEQCGAMGMLVCLVLNLKMPLLIWILWFHRFLSLAAKPKRFAWDVPVPLLAVKLTPVSRADLNLHRMASASL